MADLHFLCPTCRHSLIVDEAGAGLETNCAHCHEPVTIPAPESHGIEYEERVLCAHLKGEEERLNAELEHAAHRIAELEKSNAAPTSDAERRIAQLEGELRTEREKAAELDKFRDTADAQREATEKLSSEIAELRAAQERAAKELEDVGAERDRFREANAAKDAEMAPLFEKRTRIEAELNYAKNELEMVTEKMKVLELQIEENEAGSMKDEEEKAALRESLLSALAAQRSLKRELEETAGSLAGLGDKLRESRAAEETLRAQIASDADRIAALRGELAEAEASVAETIRATSKNEELAESQASLERMTRKLEGLRAERAALAGRAERAETLLGKVEKEAAHFAGEVHNLKSRIREGETALAAASEKLGKSETGESVVRTELAKLRAEVAALHADHSESVHALEAERAKVRALAKDLEAALSSSPANGVGGAGVEALRRMNTELITQLNDAREEALDTTEALKMIDRTVYAITTERDCYETMLNSLRANFTEVSHRLAAFEAWAEANGMMDEMEAAISASDPA